MTAPTMPPTTDETALLRRLATYAIGYEIPIPGQAGYIIALRGRGSTWGIMRTSRTEPEWWDGAAWVPKSGLDPAKVYQWGAADAPVLAEQLANAEAGGSR